MPWNWNPDDNRQEFWKEQRKEYGFDERDTWSLNYTLVLLIYPRLKMYNEINIVNTSFYKFIFEGNEYTQQECIDLILEGLETYLIKDNLDLSDDDYKNIENAFALLGLIWWSLWW